MINFVRPRAMSESCQTRSLGDVGSMSREYSLVATWRAFSVSAIWCRDIDQATQKSFVVGRRPFGAGRVADQAEGSLGPDQACLDSEGCRVVGPVDLAVELQDPHAVNRTLLRVGNAHVPDLARVPVQPGQPPMMRLEIRERDAGTMLLPLVADLRAGGADRTVAIKVNGPFARMAAPAFHRERRPFLRDCGRREQEQRDDPNNTHQKPLVTWPIDLLQIARSPRCSSRGS